VPFATILVVADEASARSGLEKRSRVYTVVSLEMLRQALLRISEAMFARSFGESDDTLQVLHLSMHGNEAGIELTSGEDVDWQTLSNALELLGPAVENLLVVMSTCHGFAGARMADRERPPPFRGIVGPKENLDWRDTVGVFVGFYHHLHTKSGRIIVGVRLMNETIGQELFDCTTGEAAEEHVSRRIRQELLKDEDFWRLLRAAPLDVSDDDREADE